MTTPQWLVTDDGIEGAGDYRGYFIDKARLGDRRLGSDGAVLNWPLHMAAKSSGVNLRDFKQAFLEAVERHREHIGRPFTRDIMRQSFADSFCHWRRAKIHTRRCRVIKREWFPERGEIMILNVEELEAVCNEATRRMLAEGWVPNYPVPEDDEDRAA